MQPPFMPLSTTSYPDPKSNVPTLSHGPTNSTMPSKSVRQASLPIQTHLLHLLWSRTFQPPPWAPSSNSGCKTSGSPPFFSRKLSSAQQKYTAYHRRLLAKHEAVRYFRHMLKARHFTILTDYNLLTFAFHQKRDKHSSRHFNHLDFISQFTTDIGHISGHKNIVADALSRVEVINAPVTHDALAAAQAHDNELRTLLVSSTTLQLHKILIPGPQLSCTATPTVAHHDRMCHLPSAVRYSTYYIPSATLVLRQRLSSSPVSCDEQFKKTAAFWPELANPASAPRFLATPSLQLATSPSLLPASYTFTST